MSLHTTKPQWDPSQDEILAAAAEIRAGWTDTQWAQHTTQAEREWIPPLCKVAINNGLEPDS
jgi:hypothetical protein